MIQSIADLVTFLKHFHRDWLDDPTLDPALISADLPYGLATIYRELGALVEIEQGPDNGWRAPFATQDSLTPLSRLKRVDRMVEFAWENSGNWSARCPIGQPDPPVYSNAAEPWKTVRRGFTVVCDSLNHFLTTLSLQEAVMGCRNLVFLRTDQGLDQILTVTLHPIWINGYYVAGEPDHHFFESADHKVLVMNWAGLWVASPDLEIRGLLAKGVDCQVLR